MEHTHRYRAAKRATIVNSSINLLLALLKIILGVIGHSHALVADGVHSLSDLFTDAVILIAAKLSTEQPDPEHPYGHRRIETIATIIVAAVLGGTAISIGYDAIHHLLISGPTPVPEKMVVIAAILSILLNEFLYHYTLYEGNKSDSELLRSNAWHNRSDALISMVVLVSVLGAMFGARSLDAIGALIIATLILKMSVKMIWKAISELIDTGADRELIENITHIITHTPGVNALHQLRTRAHGTNVLLDVHVELDPKISISEAHFIAEQVSDRLIKNIDRVTDVVVHVDPEDDQRFTLSKELPDRLTILALLDERWRDLPAWQQAKRVQLHYLNGKITLDVYTTLELLLRDPTQAIELHQALSQAVEDVAWIETVNVFYA